MGLGRDAGAAGSVDADGSLRELRFEDQRVGDNADIGAETNEFDGEFVAVGNLEHEMREAGGTEGVFLKLKMGHLFHNFADRLIEVPAGRAIEAVRDGKELPFLGGEIVVKMRIIGYKDFAVEIPDLLNSGGNDGEGFFRA